MHASQPGEARRTAARSRLAVYAACTLIALIVSCFLGQDVGWDTLDYHLYAGFSALHDRFGQDYFAAGAQSYFNPYVYVPFYAMVRAGLSPFAVSTILVLAHSTLLWVTYELGVCAGPSSPRMRLASGAGAAAFALLNPVLLYQLGSSFADIATAIPVLCGWLLLAYAVRTPRLALVVGAGLLLGAAAGLKLTNTVHAVSAAAMLIMLPRSLAGRLRYAVTYGASVALGLALVMAPWSYQLARHFGNPFFPMFNNGFHSVQHASGSLRHFRFIPDSFAEALWRPFAIAQPDSMIQVEQLAPDVRYAALLLLCAALMARWLWQHRRGGAPPVPARDPGDLRVLVALGCGLAADWVLWLHASGNGRYFLPMANVAGVLVVALLLRAFALRTAAAILAVIFAVQGVQLYQGTDRRDGALAWNHPWLELSLPPRIATEANLYLTTEVQANGFIAPYLPPGSGLINFGGGNALSLQGANGERIEALLHRYGPQHVRVLVSGSSLHSDGEKEEPLRSHVDDALARLGLRTDASDCETITARGIPAPLEAVVAGKAHEPRSPHLQLLTCATQAADPADLARRAARQRQVDLVLDRLEAMCPRLFPPVGIQTQQLGEVWMRYYGGTDLIAFVNRGYVKFVGVMRGPDARNLGKESEWAAAPVPLECGRRNGVYFARRTGAL